MVKWDCLQLNVIVYGLRGLFIVKWDCLWFKWDCLWFKWIVHGLKVLFMV